MHTRGTIRGGKTRVSASFRLLLALSVVAALLGQMMLLAGTTATAGTTTSAGLTPYVRFGVNPLTGAVTALLLQ